MAPFQPVVIDQALEETIAEIGIETIIGPVRRIGGPAVSHPAELITAELAASCPVAGEGPVLYPELSTDPIPPRYPEAAHLAEIAAASLAEGRPISPPEPLYLRRPDARVPGKPKRVTA